MTTKQTATYTYQDHPIYRGYIIEAPTFTVETIDFEHRNSSRIAAEIVAPADRIAKRTRQHNRDHNFQPYFSTTRFTVEVKEKTFRFTEYDRRAYSFDITR